MTQLCGPETNPSRKLSVLAGALAVILVIIVLAVSLTVSSKNKDVSEPLGTSMSRLRKDLFKDYDKLIIPVTGPREPVSMVFGLALINIDLLKDGTVLIDTWLRSVWNDYRLQWDEKDYGDVSVLRLPADQLWMPDIALYNSKGLTESDRNTHILRISDVNYLLYGNGEVLHIPPVTLKAHCFNSTSHGLQQDWPWGQHECKFKFGSWTYDGFGLNLTAYNNKNFVDMADFVNGPVRIMDNKFERNVKMYDCCEEPYIDLTVTLKLQKLYHVEQSGEITYNPLVDRGELSHLNYTQMGWTT